MLICGLNKTTLLDYPGHVAATIFTGGCNFRCPFCHNGDLVLHPEEIAAYEEGEIFSFLKKRQRVLEGVCITGGEPTLQPDLLPFLCSIKELGYRVKLDTNGYRPEVLRAVLEEGLADYVAMDIKGAPDNYPAATGTGNSLRMDRIYESVELLKGVKIPYEFRTTVVKGIHSVPEFHAIGEWLAGCGAYFIQSYANSDAILDPDAGYAAFSVEELIQMAEIARKYIHKVTLRGVE